MAYKGFLCLGIYGIDGIRARYKYYENIMNVVNAVNVILFLEIRDMAIPLIPSCR